jgi:hypothetical protein
MVGDGGGKARIGDRCDVASVFRGPAAQDDLVSPKRWLGELDTEGDFGRSVVDSHLRRDFELNVNLLWHRLFSTAAGEKEERCEQPGYRKYFFHFPNKIIPILMLKP